MAKTLSVAAIKDGTVIDHIPSGQALTLIRLLKLDEKKLCATVGLRLTSKSMQYKDLIKIENYFLTDKEIHDIAVFAPKATINTIKQYKVTQKALSELPTAVERILICPNPLCITRHENIDTLFFIETFKQKIHVRCNYCEKVFERDAIVEYRT
ncbi:MAG: aspartate carbamoyltransferase regulatory subunit [Verrucomicrobia bacterium]|nr:aspartate carbamoyltransferase regulatory subunit [Verrucomicrobiota bacterium]